MRLIDRYIAKHVISATLIVLLVLIGIESFIELVNELSDVGNGHYTAMKALMYVPLKLPAELYVFFPMAGLLGGLLGLGRLAQSNELCVIRAAGVSKGRIVWSVLKVALIMIAVVTLFGECAAPSLSHLGDRIKAQALGRPIIGTQAADVWLKRKQDYIHIDKVVDPHNIKGIFIFSLANHALESAIFAQSAVKKNNQWQLHSVTQTTLTPKRVSSHVIANMAYPLIIDSQAVSHRADSSHNLSIWQLWQSVRYQRSLGLSATQYLFAFWQRLFQPLMTMVMICLAVPFIFGSLRDASMGYRMVVGIFLGFGFYMLNQIFGPVSLLYAFPPWLAASLPTLLFVIYGWWLIRRSV